MGKPVIGIVDTYRQAEAVVAHLQRAGYGTSDISVLFSDAQRTRDFARARNTTAPEGAAVGAGAGGVIGGTLGLLSGIGAVAIPGLGPFIAAGPLMAALGGTAAGATVGGVTGALIGLGIPEVEAGRYEGKLREGKVLIAVHTDDAATRNAAEQAIASGRGPDTSSRTEESFPGRDRGERILRS